MNEQEMRQRTKRFALRVMKLVGALPTNSVEAQVIAKQLCRSATSVGANYRAACRARTKPEFAYKLGLVEEEADESAYWLELVVDGGLMPSDRIAELLREANALCAIVVSSQKTLRQNLNSNSRGVKDSISAVVAVQSKIRDPKSKM